MTDEMIIMYVKENVRATSKTCFTRQNDCANMFQRPKKCSCLPKMFKYAKNNIDVISPVVSVEYKLRIKNIYRIFAMIYVILLE